MNSRCPIQMKIFMLSLVIGSLSFAYFNAHTPAPEPQRIYHCLSCDEIIYADDPEACKDCVKVVEEECCEEGETEQ